jgi:hypothetical protein
VVSRLKTLGQELMTVRNTHYNIYKVPYVPVAPTSGLVSYKLVNFIVPSFAKTFRVATFVVHIAALQPLCYHDRDESAREGGYRRRSTYQNC